MNRFQEIACFLLCITIAVLLCSNTAYAATNVIVIDPAHGGEDKGVILTNKVSEKDITLKIARFVKEEMDKDGLIKVKLTRLDDRNISTKERHDFVATVNPSAFVSIHLNAGFDKKTTGFEIFFVGSIAKLNGQSEESEAILKDMQQNRYINEGIKIASAIEKTLSESFPKRSRGIQQITSPTLEGIKIPTVIVEVGFASNVDEANKLQKESEQRKIAKAISSGLRKALK
ncbi:MAG: N-acetylmuramoyl-L-alanine amidase [Deltaproteobacteria bacterium]